MTCDPPAVPEDDAMAPNKGGELALGMSGEESGNTLMASSPNCCAGFPGNLRFCVRNTLVDTGDMESCGPPPGRAPPSSRAAPASDHGATSGAGARHPLSRGLDQVHEVVVQRGQRHAEGEWQHRVAEGLQPAEPQRFAGLPRRHRHCLHTREAHASGCDPGPDLLPRHAATWRVGNTSFRSRRRFIVQDRFYPPLHIGGRQE